MSKKVAIFGEKYTFFIAKFKESGLFCKNLNSPFKMLYQSMCICVEIFITATVYVANSTGILAIPEVLAPVEHATWILVHGIYFLGGKTNQT